MRILYCAAIVQTWFYRSGVVFLLLILLLAVHAEAGSRVALVIGNGAYESGPLKNPVNDAEDMAARLKRLQFDVLLLTNITQQQTDEAVDAFYRKLQQVEIFGSSLSR